MEQFVACEDGSGGAAVGCGEGADRVEHIALAALEEVGNFVRRSGVEFFLAAFRHDPGEHGDGGAAEGVADEVDLRVVSGSTEVFQDTFIGTAETFDAVLLRVVDTVVDAAAEDVGIEFAGALPHTGEGAECRLIDLIAEVFFPVLSEVLGEGSEVLVQIAEIVLLVDAQETMDKDSRIVRCFSYHCCSPLSYASGRYLNALTIFSKRLSVLSLLTNMPTMDSWSLSVTGMLYQRPGLTSMPS